LFYTVSDNQKQELTIKAMFLLNQLEMINLLLFFLLPGSRLNKEEVLENLMRIILTKNRLTYSSRGDRTFFSTPEELSLLHLYCRIEAKYFLKISHTLFVPINK